MPVNITDVDEFTDPITAPAGADAANAASVVAPVQKLANRTRHTKNRVDVLASRFHTSGAVVVRDADGDPAMIGHIRKATVAAGVEEDAGGFTRVDPAYARSEINGARFIFDLGAMLPASVFLTRVDVFVNPGAERSDGNRMKVQIDWANYLDAGIPTFSSGTTDSTHGTANPQPTGFQRITLELAEPTSLDEVDTWQLIVTCGHDAGTNKDKIYGIFVWFEVDVIRGG